jgi:hypothetical protein
MELIASPELQKETGIHVIFRDRESAEQIPLRTVLSDTDCRPAPDAIVDEVHGFYRLPANKSALFVSRSLGSDGEGAITACTLCTIDGIYL